MQQLFKAKQTYYLHRFKKAMVLVREQNWKTSKEPESFQNIKQVCCIGLTTNNSFSFVIFSFVL